MNTLLSSAAGSGSGFGSIMMLGSIVGVVMLLVLFVLILIPFCLVFKKAGRAWWEALVPIYNTYVLTIIVGVPWWYLFGFFIPFLNWIVAIYFMYRLSKRFGFDILFTLGLVFLPFIFYPILGYGSAVYIVPETESEDEVSSNEEEVVQQVSDQNQGQPQDLQTTQQSA
jgi:hypothetical protein